MRELKSQFAGALLLVLTVAAVIAAIINLDQHRKFHLPTDKIVWMDETGKDGKNRVIAAYLQQENGEIAGIHKDDQVLRINELPIQTAVDVAKALDTVRSRPKQTKYLLRRNGIEFEANPWVIDVEAGADRYYQYVVGFTYLAIGFFVFYRRTSAPKSLHFFILCLTSFVASCFHYTGKLNNFDQVMYWGNMVAGLAAPSMFLHFCFTFPDRPKWLKGKRNWMFLYLPAFLFLLILVATALGILRFILPLSQVQWILDRGYLAFFVLLYALGTVALTLQYRKVQDPIVRRQLKYLRNGALVGVGPFALFYVIPYVLGFIPSPLMKLTVLSLGLIPLTWAYAITRYRLMDVDVIFQQGYVYTLATLAVIGTFYGLIFYIGNLQSVQPSVFVLLIVFATFIFQPIRAWIQEQLDRYVFYRDRYDYRLTLIEFARELSSETNLERMLASVSDRLLHTLSIQRVAFFLADENERSFHLHSENQRSGDYLPHHGSLDLSFLPLQPAKPYLFFERPKYLRDIVSAELPESVRRTIAELDLTYYVACATRGKTIAYLGVSRTAEDDFLSSDDVELLVTLSGYVAIAIENSRLYRSLQRKVDEYERLKEFSENIVESINVGILAADLDDRVESWNTQIEKLTGIARDQAVGRRLRELLPEDLCQRFDEVRGQNGIHNVYRFVLRPRDATIFHEPAKFTNYVSASSTASSTSSQGGLGNGHALGNGHRTRESTVNLAIAPLVSKDLEQIGRLIIFDDVTDRDELERQLVQADKLSSIGLLAAGVAHEVNTPLAVISTYAQMLAKQVSEDDQKSKLLEKIARQTFRASEIVNSLLNFSRTSTTEFVEVSLTRIVRETITLIEHQLKKAGVETRLNLDDDLPVIRGNAGKLQQVLLNLFLNARDAMEEGGLLTIRTWFEPGFVHVEVADTGQGISSEHLERIFDPFFTTKAAKKGTGLGLSVTYGIVQEHSGIIEVVSEVGSGTRFRLEFPVVGNKAQMPPASSRVLIA